VLACAFSNVGADQLALSLIKVGLKVVRVGKPSSVTQDLWKYTLDAAVNADPDAQRALEAASKATAKLGNGKLRGSEKNAATDAVKASILVSAYLFMYSKYVPLSKFWTRHEKLQVLERYVIATS